MTWNPRVLMRAVVQSPKLASTLRATLTATDWLFSNRGPYGPEAKFPYYTYGDLGSAAPQMTTDTKTTPIVPLYGEKSDFGARDPLTGALKSKGLIPGVYLGKFIVDLGSTPVDDGLPKTQNMSLGSVSGMTILGSDGGDWVNQLDPPSIDGDPYHPIAAVYGGVIGPLVGTRASTPSDREGSHSFRPVWLAATGTPDYYVSFQVPQEKGDAWQPFTGDDDGVRYQIVSATPSNPYTDWQFIAYWPSKTSGLAWGQPGIGSSGDSEWGIISFGLGEWFQWLQAFGSDLGGGNPANQHDRTELNIASMSGTQLLVPGFTPCPWSAFTLTNPDTGRTFDLAAIGVRGPLLDDHINGVVNIAVNAIGLMNADRLPIMGVFHALQHCRENFFILRKSAGPWVTTSTKPTYRDGTPIVNSSSHAACQLATAAALGGSGLLVSWYPDRPTATTEWETRFMAWTESKTGVDGHGQVRPWMIDTAADISAWPRINHVTEIFGQLGQSFGEERENLATMVYDYDADKGVFRGGTIPEKSPVGIRRYKAEKPGDLIENALLADENQARWVLQRRIARLGLGTKLITAIGPVGWLDYDIGQGVRLTSDDGTGDDGYVDRPMIITRRQFDMKRRLTTLTLWDVSDLLLATRFTNAESRRSAMSNTPGSGTPISNDADRAALVLA